MLWSLPVFLAIPAHTKSLASRGRTKPQATPRLAAVRGNRCAQRYGTQRQTFLLTTSSWRIRVKRKHKHQREREREHSRIGTALLQLCVARPWPRSMTSSTLCADGGAISGDRVEFPAHADINSVPRSGQHICAPAPGEVRTAVLPCYTHTTNSHIRSEHLPSNRNPGSSSQRTATSCQPRDTRLSTNI